MVVVVVVSAMLVRWGVCLPLGYRGFACYSRDVSGKSSAIGGWGWGLACGEVK